MKKYGKLLPLFLAAPLLMSCGNKKVEQPKVNSYLSFKWCEIRVILSKKIFLFTFRRFLREKFWWNNVFFLYLQKNMIFKL